MSIQSQFEDFHALNPWVYTGLVRLARQYVDIGVTHEGVGHLWEVLRYEKRITTHDPNTDYRLNNNYRSRYARLIMDREPDLAGFFEIRELKTLYRSGYRRPRLVRVGGTNGN